MPEIQRPPAITPLLRPWRNLGRNSVPRLLIFLTCSLLLFVLSPHATGLVRAARAMSAATGHISGQLLNGSNHSSPVGNQSVTLQMLQGNSSRDLITLTTDGQGRYAFSALESDASVQYAVYTLYQQAQYFTDLIDLSKNANQQINLTVYDATNSTTNLAVVQLTVLLTKTNAQSSLLTISEDFFFENLGLKTYVGSLDASKGKPNALLFALPASARFLSLGESFNGYKNAQVDTGFASTAAVPPGQSEFSFSFQVPYSGTTYQFDYQAVYPTVALTVLTPLDILATPHGLTARGSSNTPSGIYQKFSTQTLGAGQSVALQLASLPLQAPTTSQQTAVNPGQIWLVVLLILLIALAGVGAFLYNARRRRAKQITGQKKGPPATSKKAGLGQEALLREMLELDQAYEHGKLKKAAYQEQRSRLKARLRNLVSEQQETASKATPSGGGKK